MAQLKGLFVLSRGPLTIGRLSINLGIIQSTASIVVERLIRLGLVVRDDDRENRRRILARLSAEDEQIVTRLGDHRREHLYSEISQCK